MKPPFKMWTRDGSAAANAVYEQRFNKVMKLSPAGRKNYLTAKGWKFMRKSEPFMIDGKEMIRLYYSHEKLRIQEIQTQAIRTQLWWDMEQENLIKHWRDDDASHV